jgi:hypothetical protein
MSPVINLLLVYLPPNNNSHYHGLGMTRKTDDKIGEISCTPIDEVAP